MAGSARQDRQAGPTRDAERARFGLLRRRIDEFHAHLAAALEGDPTAVHRARVASRRLRECLPVLVPSSRPQRSARRTVRRTTRALGRVREMDVGLAVLDELADRPAIPRPAVEDVRAHVLVERDRRRRQMLERLRDRKLDRLRRRLDEMRRPIADGPHRWQDKLRRRVARRAGRLESAVEKVGRVYAPEGLHQVRIAAKRLRYALELAHQARIVAGRSWIRMLKRTQDTLGRMHDLQVLQHHVGELMTGAPARQGRSDGGLSIIEGTLEEECRHLHARYSSQVPELIEVIAASRAAVLPQPGRRGARNASIRMLHPSSRPPASRLA